MVIIYSDDVKYKYNGYNQHLTYLEYPVEWGLQWRNSSQMSWYIAHDDTATKPCLERWVLIRMGLRKLKNVGKYSHSLWPSNARKGYGANYTFLMPKTQRPNIIMISCSKWPVRNQLSQTISGQITTVMRSNINHKPCLPLVKHHSYT